MVPVSAVDLAALRSLQILAILHLRVDDVNWAHRHFRVCVNQEPSSTKTIVDGRGNGFSTLVSYLFERNMKSVLTARDTGQVHLKLDLKDLQREFYF